MVVGVGVGGTFEKCAILAKKALTRPVNEHSEIPYVADLEKEMLEKSISLVLDREIRWNHYCPCC